MEIDKFIQGDNDDDFTKENTVQEIFKESVNGEEEICHNSDLLTTTLNQYYGCVAELTENLMLCQASVVNQNLLNAFNISCVINVAPELPDPPLNSDIIYHKVPIHDNTSSKIYDYFDETADLIQKITNRGGRCLVYCVAGVSRSTTMCLAYLMKQQQLTLLEAYNFVKNRRSKIKPNCSFFRQLIDYEKTLFGCNTVKMVFNEMVQMEIPDVYNAEYQLVNQFSKKRRDQNGRY